MGDAQNYGITGQQKLVAIQALGMFKDVESFDKADAAHQYEIAFNYDSLKAAGKLPPENVDSIAHVEATASIPVTQSEPQGSPTGDADAEAIGGVDVGQQ
jgi:hypothetical protein